MGIAAQQYPLSLNWDNAKRNDNALKKLKEEDAIIASIKDHRFAGYGTLKSDFYVGGPSLRIPHLSSGELMEFHERFDCDWTVIPLDRNRPYISCDDLKKQGFDIDLMRGQCVKQIDEEAFNALKLKLDNFGARREFPVLEKNSEAEINAYVNEIGTNERKYWLWVTRPEYYLDVNGNDRADLDPNSGFDPDSWWTCHKETKKGDLVLLWRSKLKRDIGYLLQAESAAYRSPNDDEDSKKGWKYRCNYRVLYKFENTITAKELRGDSYFNDWSPLKINFQGSVFLIQEPYWNRLNQIALAKNPDYRKIISPRPSLEVIVEEDLESLNAEEEYNEGKRSKHFVNSYERNRLVIIAARRIHGTKCMVCGFDFEQRYGLRGSGYIEVHHLHPVSSLKGETKVDPKTEMAVVCSNCHRMIHRKKDEVLSLEELKVLLHKQDL